VCNNNVNLCYLNFSYVFQYVFTTPATNTPNNTVHDQLLAHLPSLLNPDNTDFLLINKFLINSNFFFQIVIKSMGQYLLTSNRIKVQL
jgi:dedicator of cytokinesis protein 9/10/11